MTSFTPTNLSILIQGPTPDEFNLRFAADHLRSIFPGCEVIRSTSETGKAMQAGDDDAFDKVVRHADIGGLPSLKFTDSRTNNANRQFQSVQAGLAACSRDYVLRLRSDQTAMSQKLVDIWQTIEGMKIDRPYAVGRARILTSSLFSINPRFDERMPYHVSDMLQFGFKEDVQRYFSPPNIPLDVATWYERNPHQDGSYWRERLFRSRYAVEQWLCMHYLSPGSLPLRYHNDCRPNAIELFEERMVDNFIIAHPRDIDLRVPRFDHASRSLYFNATCYSMSDWLDLAQRLRGASPVIPHAGAYPRTMEQKKRIVKAVSSKYIMNMWRKLPPRIRKLAVR